MSTFEQDTTEPTAAEYKAAVVQTLRDSVTALSAHIDALEAADVTDIRASAEAFVEIADVSDRLAYVSTRAATYATLRAVGVPNEFAEATASAPLDEATVIVASVLDAIE